MIRTCQQCQRTRDVPKDSSSFGCQYCGYENQVTPGVPDEKTPEKKPSTERDQFLAEFVDLPGAIFRETTRERKSAEISSLLSQRARDGWQFHSATRVSASNVPGGTFLFVFRQDLPPI